MTIFAFVDHQLGYLLIGFCIFMLALGAGTNTFGESKVKIGFGIAVALAFSIAATWLNFI